MKQNKLFQFFITASHSATQLSEHTTCSWNSFGKFIGWRLRVPGNGWGQAIVYTRKQFVETPRVYNTTCLPLIFVYFIPDVQCQVKADICFLIDSSGSIRDAGPQNWDIMLNFASQVRSLHLQKFLQKYWLCGLIKMNVDRFPILPCLPEHRLMCGCVGLCYSRISSLRHFTFWFIGRIP